jgi:hypothetical protein
MMLSKRLRAGCLQGSSVRTVPWFEKERPLRELAQGRDLGSSVSQAQTQEEGRARKMDTA